MVVRIPRVICNSFSNYGSIPRGRPGLLKFKKESPYDVFFFGTPAEAGKSVPFLLRKYGSLYRCPYTGFIRKQLLAKLRAAESDEAGQASEGTTSEGVEQGEEKALFDQIHVNFSEFLKQVESQGTADSSLVFTLQTQIAQYFFSFFLDTPDSIDNQVHFRKVLGYHWQLTDYTYSVTPDQAPFISHRFLLPLFGHLSWGKEHLPFFANVLRKLEKKEALRLLARDLCMVYSRNPKTSITYPGLKNFVNFLVLQKNREKPGYEVNLLSETRNLLKKLVKEKSMTVLSDYLMDSSNPPE